MCTVCYYGNPKNTEEEEYVRAQGQNNVVNSWKRFKTARHYLYSRDWMENGGGGPDRQAWIDRLRQIGYFDAPGLIEGTATE